MSKITDNRKAFKKSLSSIFWSILSFEGIPNHINVMHRKALKDYASKVNIPLSPDEVAPFIYKHL